MNNPLLVGVDVHRKTNTIALMERSGREVGPPFTVANNRPGTEALAQQLSALAAAEGYEAIQVAAEATG